MSLLEKIKEDNANAHGDSSYGDQNVFWNKYGEFDGYNIVESEILDQRRWVTVMRDIVTHEGFPDEYASVTYEEGSTEMQEGDRDNTLFQKVVPKEVTVVKYVVEK